jgi:hypothetical protein
MTAVTEPTHLPPGGDYDLAVLAATEVLIQQSDEPAGRVVAAVARAKRRTIDLYRLIDSPLPPPRHFEAMVLAGARRDLQTEQ